MTIHTNIDQNIAQSVANTHEKMRTNKQGKSHNEKRKRMKKINTQTQKCGKKEGGTTNTNKKQSQASTKGGRQCSFLF